MTGREMTGPRGDRETPTIMGPNAKAKAIRNDQPPIGKTPKRTGNPFGRTTQYGGELADRGERQRSDGRQRAASHRRQRERIEIGVAEREHQSEEGAAKSDPASPCAIAAT